MTKKLRVGIAGLGRIFDLNCLGYVNHPDVDVVGLCDVRPDLVEQRRASFPGARGTTRYEELLGWDLDLVDILTRIRCTKTWRTRRWLPALTSASRNRWQ